MSLEKLQIMIMQHFWGVKELYYEICSSRKYKVSNLVLNLVSVRAKALIMSGA